MLKQIYAFLAFLAAFALPAATFAQEHTRDAVGKCDEASALQGDCQNSPDTNSEAGHTGQSGSADPVRAPRPLAGNVQNPDYVNFQTSDKHFNSIMNYIDNNPSGCITEQDDDYVGAYVGEHPEICDAVSRYSLRTSVSPGSCGFGFAICQ